jgi:hypothetical protein
MEKLSLAYTLNDIERGVYMDKSYRSVYRELREAVKQAVDHNQLPDPEPIDHYHLNWATAIIIVALLVLFMAMIQGCAYSATLDQWADNIRITEGIHSNFPYGIKIKDNMGKLRHYSPFKARIICKRTIWHKWRNYCKLPLKTRQTIDFIQYLGDIYCPYIDDRAGNIRWKLTMRRLMEGWN